MKGNKNFSDFFGKLTKQFTENIFFRLDEKIITSDAPVKKNKMVLFQFIGSLKKLTKFEILKFKFLAQFMEEPESFGIIQNALFVDWKEVQFELSKLSNADVLLSWLYLNLATMRLLGKSIRMSSSKINPNMNKIFLRHYPDYAKDHSINIVSEDEDYVFEAKKPKKTDDEEIERMNQPNFKAFGKKPSKRSKNSKYTRNTKHVFVAEKHEEANTTSIREEDLVNKYDFPQINEDLSSVLPTKKPAQAEEDDNPVVGQAIGKKKKKNNKVKGWGNGDIMIYKQNKMSKKDMNKMFPTLGGAPKQNNNKPAPSAQAVKKKPIMGGWGQNTGVSTNGWGNVGTSGPGAGGLKPPPQSIEIC